MIAHYSKILHETSLGWAMGGGIPWLWPVFAILHLIGMAILVGCVGALDLRLLGIGKQLPLGPLRGLIPPALVGFAINLVTGIGFYAGAPDRYHSFAFAAKMGCIVLAGANGLLFYGTGLSARIGGTGPEQEVPLGAKFSAVASLLLWAGVMFWGRMLPVFSNGF